MTGGQSGIGVVSGGSGSSGAGANNSGRTGSASLVPGGGNLEGIDDTQMDLSSLNEAGTPGGRTVPNTPKLIVTSPSTNTGGPSGSGGAGGLTTAESEAVLILDDDDENEEPEQQQQLQQSASVDTPQQHPQGHVQEEEDAVPGPSQTGDVPTITVTPDEGNEEEEDDDDVDVDDEPESDGTEQQNATTSQQSTSSSSSMGVRGKSQEEGTDGVSSEGEKPQSGQESAVEVRTI